jgi:hypothetical protein
MGFRVYSEEFGRFLSPDPLFEQFDNWTPYHFAYNNPIMFSDPSGLAPNKEKGENKLLISQGVLETYALMKKMQDDYVQEYIDKMLRHTMMSFSDELLSYSRWKGGGGSKGESTGNFTTNTSTSLGNPNTLERIRVVNYDKGVLNFASEEDAQELANENNVTLNLVKNDDGTLSATKLTTHMGSVFNDQLLWDSFNTVLNSSKIMISSNLDMRTEYDEKGALIISGSTYTDASKSKYNMPTIFMDKNDILNSNKTQRTYLNHDYRIMFSSYSEIFWHEFGHSYYLLIMDKNVGMFNWFALRRRDIGFGIAVGFQNYYLNLTHSPAQRWNHDYSGKTELTYYFPNDYQKFYKTIKRFK